MLWTSISTTAFADSTVSALTQVQFDQLVAELKAIYDERQPDVALFGESHCEVQPYQFLAAEATVAMHAAAGYVAALVEEPADSQRYYDHLIAMNQVKNPTPQQRQAAEAFEEGIVNADVKSSAVDCPPGVTRTNAIGDVTLAKQLAAHDMAYQASDYTGQASDALQDQFAKTHDPELRKQFNAVRLDERRAAKGIRSAVSVGHVFVIRGTDHFLNKSDKAMRENLAGLKVLTFIFDYTGHTVRDDETRIRNEGVYRFNPPDFVIDVTPRHAGIYPWVEGRSVAN